MAKLSPQRAGEGGMDDGRPFCVCSVGVCKIGFWTIHEQENKSNSGVERASERAWEEDRRTHTHTYPHNMSIVLRLSCLGRETSGEYKKKLLCVCVKA